MLKTPNPDAGIAGTENYVQISGSMVAGLNLAWPVPNVPAHVPYTFVPSDPTLDLLMTG